MSCEYELKRIREVCEDLLQDENSSRETALIKVLRSIIGAVSNDAMREDAAFFNGELEENIGEKNTEYPAHVIAFKERRKKRMDASGDEEGRWVTTENDHKIHINTEGVPDKGNPHVLAAMTSGTKTREEIGRSRLQKIRKKIAGSQAKYKAADEKVQSAAKKYSDINTQFKRVSRRIEMGENVYKKALEQAGIKDGDREKLKKEVEELEKKKKEKPFDQDISAAYNSKSFLLSEYDEVYGEEAKEDRRVVKRLEKENEEAKRSLDRAVAERRKLREDISREAGKKNVQKMKFYSDAERDEAKQSVLKSDAFAKLTEEERGKIAESISTASDAQLSVLKKTCGKAKIMRQEETAATGSCYMDGNGVIYLEEEDRKTPRVFWHEYGHFMDDFSHSGLEDSVVLGTEGTTYESSSRSFSQILHRGVKICGADAAKDLQEMFDSVAPGEFKVEANKDEDWIFVRSAKTGELAEESGDAFNMQEAFDKVCTNFLNGGPNGGEAGEYKRSIGFPDESERPKRSDYIEEYETPKRKIRREREKFKGASDEYYAKLQEFYNKEEEAKRQHPEYEEKMREFWSKRGEREKLLPAVTDCVCASLYGQVFSIYGCHDRSYYRTGSHAEKEWAANIHQMMFMGQKESLDLLTKIMPRTMKKVKAAYNEYLWRNLSE